MLLIRSLHSFSSGASRHNPAVQGALRDKAAQRP